MPAFKSHKQLPQSMHKLAFKFKNMLNVQIHSRTNNWKGQIAHWQHDSLVCVLDKINTDLKSEKTGTSLTRESIS